MTLINYLKKGKEIGNTKVLGQFQACLKRQLKPTYNAASNVSGLYKGMYLNLKLYNSLVHDYIPS